MIMKRKRLDADAIDLAIKDCLSPAMIAPLYGCCERTVLRYLRKHRANGAVRKMPCSVCKIDVIRRRAHVRKTKATYCSRECYYKHLDNS